MSQQPNPTDGKNSPTSELNSPEVDKSGKPTKRAVTSAKQAYDIAKNIRDRHVGEGGRIPQAAAIAKRYGAANPKSVYAQNRAGQNEMNNFSTNFLGGIIDRTKPQITEPITSAQFLTQSTLPDGVENGEQKARLFNKTITDTIREWPEYSDFLDGLAQDVVLFGNAAPARIDADWRPKLWRYDETYLAEGTGQHANQVQVAVFCQRMMVHEFLKLIEDPVLADKAGYNIEGCAKVANAAFSAQNAGKEPTPLELEDSVREQSSYSYSYGREGQTKTIDLYHVLVHDFTGEVDLWTVSQNDGTEVRQVKAKEKSMDDATTLFTFQTGNRKFYGSKGLGRFLTNISLSIELGRCSAMDKCGMAGLPILEGEGGALQTQAKVRWPFICLESGQKITGQTIEFDYEGFDKMDRKLTEIAEGIAGAFIPPDIDNTGSSTTKIEAAEKAVRDKAVQKGVLARFAKQHAQLVDMMKRAICSPLNIREAKRAYDKNQAKKAQGLKVLPIKVFNWLLQAFGAPKAAAPEAEASIADRDAVSAIIKMLEGGLQVDEIAALALCKTRQTKAEDGAEQDEKTLQFIAANKADPHVDQKKARTLEAKITMGEERAKELIRPEPDRTNEAHATREQTIEFSEMLDGNPMPVAPDDDHTLHCKALAGKLEPVMESIQQAPTPEMVNAAELACHHYLEHLAADQTKNPQAKGEEENVIKEYLGIIAKVKTALERAAQEQAAAQPPPPGAPPSPEEQKEKRESLLSAAELDLRAKELDLRARELDLQAAQHAHTQEVDAAKLQQKNLEMAQRAAEHASNQELEREKIEAAHEAAEKAAAAKAKQGGGE